MQDSGGYVDIQGVKLVVWGILEDEYPFCNETKIL